MSMDEKDADQTSQADCCLENKQPNCCQPTTGNAECSTPSKKPWIKMLVFILVMLAAAGVGAYSILSRSGDAEMKSPASTRGSPEKATVNPARQPAEPCCPSREVAAPATAEPCCPSQEGAPAMPKPACGNECARPCCGGE